MVGLFYEMEHVFEDGCLIVATGRSATLMLSDLHLGYHAELSVTSGADFPSQHNSMLKRLETLTEKYGITGIYILGDVKHTITVDSPANWQIVPEFMTNLAELAETRVIPGNHDGKLRALLPRSIFVEDVHGVVIGSGSGTIGLVHGHAWPAPEVLDARMIVKGHNHPAVLGFKSVRVPGRKGSVRTRYTGNKPVILRSKLDKNCVREKLGIITDLDDSRGLVVSLPSFNSLVSGVPINRPGSGLDGPIFRNNCAEFLTSEVFSVDGLLLGTVKELQKRFDEKILQRND